MSLALLPRLRLWTLLLLAAIGLQAASPMRAPLERVQGSAFSASTIDVALASTRKAESAANAAQVTPPSPQTLARTVTPLATTLALADQPRLRPEARGPPPRRHPARVPDSTAPPLA